jgi:hypothetical protein
MKTSLYCNVCGKKFLHNFQLAADNPLGGQVCSMECVRELNWRKTLSILGKEYSPRKNSGTTL